MFVDTIHKYFVYIILRKMQCHTIFIENDSSQREMLVYCMVGLMVLIVRPSACLSARLYVVFVNVDLTADNFTQNVYTYALTHTISYEMHNEHFNIIYINFNLKQQ